MQRVVHGWRLGIVIGSGMIRIWLGKIILTLYDAVGPMKEN